jgi:hypothetical protein
MRFDVRVGDPVANSVHTIAQRDVLDIYGMPPMKGKR